MSQQDVMTVRSAYEAYNRGDIPGTFSAFDRQIEWQEPGGGRSSPWGHGARVRRGVRMPSTRFEEARDYAFADQALALRERT